MPKPSKIGLKSSHGLCLVGGWGEGVTIIGKRMNNMIPFQGVVPDNSSPKFPRPPNKYLVIWVWAGRREQSGGYRDRELGLAGWVKGAEKEGR